MEVKNKSARRPELLGIRPVHTKPPCFTCQTVAHRTYVLCTTLSRRAQLPQYATLEEAIAALKPRELPTAAMVEAALAEARANDEEPSDDESETKKFNHRTALIKTDPEYFGFVG